MRLYLLDNESENNFDELASCIRGKKVIAFIGAGLSVSAGYRKWSEGILGNDNQKGEFVSGLIHVANISDEIIQNHTDDLPMLAEECKKSLDQNNVDEFRNFLLKEFGRRDLQSDCLNHVLIWKTNFSHIITTNFDPCLYETSVNLLRYTSTYPNDMEYSNERTLYHIHGRAFLVDKDPKPIEYYLDRVVYTRSQYRLAYEKGFELKKFIYEITKRYSLVFLGFSMEDDDFKNTFREVKQARETLDNQIDRTIQKPHFIFLHPPLHQSGESEESFKNRNTNFANHLSNFRDMGLKTIIYLPLDNNYSGLTNALKDLNSLAQFPIMATEKQSDVQPISNADSIM